MDEYRCLILAWDKSQEEPKKSSKKANRIWDEIHELYKQLRIDEAGRSLINDLLGDPIPVVRLVAATHVLPWAPERGRAVLSALQQGKDLYAFDAKWTLRSFDEGQLNLDW